MFKWMLLLLFLSTIFIAWIYSARPTSRDLSQIDKRNIYILSERVQVLSNDLQIIGHEIFSIKGKYDHTEIKTNAIFYRESFGKVYDRDSALEVYHFNDGVVKHEGLIFCGTNFKHCIIVHLLGIWDEGMISDVVHISINLEDKPTPEDIEDGSVELIQITEPSKFHCSNFQNLWQVVIYLFDKFKNKFAMITGLFESINAEKIEKNTIKKINCASASQYIRMYCGLPYCPSCVAVKKLKFGGETIEPAKWTCASYWNSMNPLFPCLEISDECMHIFEHEEFIGVNCGHCACYQNSNSKFSVSSINNFE